MSAAHWQLQHRYEFTAQFDGELSVRWGQHDRRYQRAQALEGLGFEPFVLERRSKLRNFIAIQSFSRTICSWATVGGRTHTPEPFETRSVALLRQLQVKDPALSFAWRVRQLRDCFHAEVWCAPDIGIGFHADGPFERVALAFAVRDAVRHWRHPESRWHLHPEMSTAEIDLANAGRIVMSGNLNGAPDGPADGSF